MSKHLVIVESPTKAKTIKRFLGKDYAVQASMGHIRDLPSSTLAVDVEHGFEPEYEVPDEKKATVKKLQEELDEAESLWIATDEDREGEAIGWHLTQVLKRKKNQDIKRIVFHEITEGAIKEAVENPREIDNRLVEAQQARRVLDRLVGYTLSPFLWKKVYRGLSAGRVQSVSVRLIVDREREIQAFNPVEYWTIDAQLQTDAGETFSAGLSKKDGKKFVPGTKEESDAVVSAVKGGTWKVDDIEEKELKRTRPPPFTTSTLQQEASRKLGFSVKQNMVVAQQLYEGIDLGKGEGATGLITYMRTDSVTLSQKALGDAKDVIQKLYGREYVLSEARLYKTKSKNAQEAHEAIRPTEMMRTPESLKDVLDPPQLKLYTLIWNRTVATQMAQAELKRVAVDIGVSNYTFRATGQTVLFDGFMRLYIEDRDEGVEGPQKEEEDDGENGNKLLPPLSKDQQLKLEELLPLQHFTKPPPRYTEASLVKKLEEEGIGRPSTYAPTISTVQQRGYIRKEGKQLVPEEVAFTVTDLLTDHFTNIVDLGFTAQMEQLLDDVSNGERDWRVFLGEFYGPFESLVKQKTTEVSKDDVMKERIVGTDPATGLDVIVRIGRFGPYVQLGRAEDLPQPVEAVEEEVKPKKGKGKAKKPKAKKGPKPKSASLPPSMKKDDVTLEQALGLLSFPRSLGMHDADQVTVSLGRFGPYMKCGEATVSVPKDLDPVFITLDQAIRLIEEAKEKRKRQAEPLRTLGKDSSGRDIHVKEGRYGPYVTDSEINATIPKKLDPQTITFDEAIDLIAKKRAKGPSKWGKFKKGAKK